MSSNADIIGTTLTGVTGLLGVKILSNAAKMLDDDTDPEDLPKNHKGNKIKKRDTWY